ncbi:MAG: hypothetical protein F9K23_08620 [Bacteroidetes bacterium]|nr:MAG: hypothetical protein F9K23_08620 [Bacteroidota bacterium]
MENTNELYKRLETLVAHRKALSRQTDHLRVMEQEHTINGYPKMRLSIESHPHTFKTVNKAVIKKVFALLQAEYRELIKQKEQQIQALTLQLNTPKP